MKSARRPPAARARPLLLLALLLGATAAARAETVWADGFELEVTLRPAKVVMGEPVVLWLELANRSDTDLELLLSGERDGGWPDGFEVTVEGPGGVARRPLAEEREASSTILLRAGQSLGVAARMQRWAAFARPGVYTVSYRRGLRAAAYDGRVTVLMDVEKPAVEFRVRARVEVTQGGEDAVGALIEELGPKISAPAPDAMAAAQRLAQLGDERVVRYFVEAYRRSRNAGVKSTALTVFPKFRGDLALEGLKLGAADPDEDFRTAAASALTHSRHPEAPRVLAGLRRDPHYGVRLVVLYALEKMGTPEARHMIWEMTNDRHEGVRGEALRILQAPTPGLRP